MSSDAYGSSLRLDVAFGGGAGKSSNLTSGSGNNTPGGVTVKEGPKGNPSSCASRSNFVCGVDVFDFDGRSAVGRGRTCPDCGSLGEAG